MIAEQQPALLADCFRGTIQRELQQREWHLTVEQPVLESPVFVAGLQVVRYLSFPHGEERDIRELIATVTSRSGLIPASLQHSSKGEHAGVVGKQAPIDVSLMNRPDHGCGSRT